MLPGMLISLILSYSIVFIIQFFVLCRIRQYGRNGDVFNDCVYSRNWTAVRLDVDYQPIRMSQKELFLFGMTLSGEDREKFEFIFKYKLEPNWFKRYAMIVKDTHKELMISMFKINK